MIRRLILIAALLAAVAGCQTEQQQNQEKWRELHEKVRHQTPAPAPPPQWTGTPDAQEEKP